MIAKDESSSIAGELAKLEATCQQVARDLASTRSVRETMGLGDVEVPHHLRSIAHIKVPTLARLARMRDLRVEEVVKHQLSSLAIERSELVASRELDRLKAVDWTLLRAGYPDLYGKALREANLILERKRKR